MISERSGIVDLATRNNIDGVRQLLASNPGAVNEQDQYKETPLTRASYNNNKEMVELLLAAGATVNLGNKWDECPLFWAVASKKKDVVEVLLAAGANVDLQNKDGYSPLFLAAANNNTEVAEMLLKAGADVDLPDKKDGKTALTMAKNNGFSEMVSLLENQTKAPKEVIWGRSRIMIVGEGRAGKTSFYKAMKGIKFSENTESTCGLEKSYVRFPDIGHSEENIVLGEVVGDALNVAASKQIYRDKKEKEKNNDTLSEEKEVSSLSSEKDGRSTLEFNGMIDEKDEKDSNNGDVDVVLRDLPLNLDAMSANNVSTKSKEESKVGVSVEEEKGVPITLLGNISHKDIDISVIDYGGQSIFHCFHHLFLKPYGVYCILFNMQKFLTDEVNTLYHIKYWYNTIMLHTSDQKNGKVNSDIQMIIVGSHRDKLKRNKLKADIIDISKKIHDSLRDSPGFTNIVKCPDILVQHHSDHTEFIIGNRDEYFFFPVDNASKNKTETVFQNLMISIFKAISKSNYVSEKININYFVVLGKLEEQYCRLNVVKRDAILEFIKSIKLLENITDQSLFIRNSALTIFLENHAAKVLQFFIDKGVFLEFKDKIIFHFDTFLISSITKVIYDPRYHNRNIPSKYEWDPEFQILMKRGVVSDAFIRELLCIDTETVQDNSKDANQNMAAEAVEQNDSTTETNFIIEFMVDNQLMICVDKKSDEENKLYLIPSLLSESKLTYNRFLSPSALFFFKIRSERNDGLNLGNCFMSDNLFYQLMCKLIELSKDTYVREEQDNFIFKDLIMIKLGAHIIVVKSFPEANCIQLHALNECILQNYITILTYLIDNEITPSVDFDIIIDQKTIYNSTLGLEKNINNNHKVLIHCPKKMEDHKTLPMLIVTLSNYDKFVMVEFHENKNEIESLRTDIQGFELLLIVNTIVGTSDEFRNSKGPKIIHIDACHTTVNKELDLHLGSSGLESGSLYDNYSTIKLFKSNMYTGNSAQRFYNAASRIYYGWEASSHNEDQMLYFNVAVSPTEINIFFRCILCLNGSYYVIRQLPELLAGTVSPAKFLGSILKETLESLFPNMGRESKDSVFGYDVSLSYKILVCLVQLSSAITTAISTHPTESEELQQYHKKVEGIIQRLLSSESMREEARILSALLGRNICPLLDRYKNRDEGLRKLRAAVFTDSIIVTYITEKENESNMYTLIGSWQVLTVIDNAFWNSSRICTVKGTNISRKTCAGLQKKSNDRFKSLLGTIYCQLSATSTNCSHLGSNPSLLLFLEFLSSMLNLILVIVISFQDDESIFKDHLRSFLCVMVLGVLLRELGELHSGFFRFSQSLYGRNVMLVCFRTAAVYLKDFWNMFDVMGLLSLLCWSILQFKNQPPYSPSVEMTLSLTLKLSAIPLTIGLLRYFLVLKDIGQFIILIFSMTFDLWRFGFIYLFILLGFGISLKAIFYEYEEFYNIFNLFVSMFQMSLNTLTYDTFDHDEKRIVGQIILITMVLSVSIIIVNAIIAKFGITFQNINENVSGIWAINKARYIARYFNNRSPALMLPPPLNIAIFALFLAMRVCAWLCNIAVFFIPEKQIHNRWYAQADLIKDLSIGVCSSISLAIVSVIMLPICAVVEACVFVSSVFPLCISASIDNILSVDHNSLFTKKILPRITVIISILLESMRKIFDIGDDSWVFEAHKILKVFIAVFCYIIYFFFRVIMFAVFFLFISILSVVAIVALLIVFIIYLLLLLHAILMTFADNMNFLRYRVIIMTHFLTREGKDIWDLQAPKLLEEMKKKANPDYKTIDENYTKPDNNTIDGNNRKPDNNTIDGNHTKPDNNTIDGNNRKPDNNTIDGNNRKPDNNTIDENHTKSDNNTIDGNNRKSDNNTIDGNHTKPDNNTIDGNNRKPDNNTIDGNHMLQLESLYPMTGQDESIEYKSNELIPPATSTPSPVSRMSPPILCSMGHTMSRISPGPLPEADSSQSASQSVCCHVCRTSHMETTSREYLHCDRCRSYLCGNCEASASIDLHLSRLNIISRIEWFYYNIAPEQSLRFIYEENEYGLGKEFLLRIIGYLRKGVDKIRTKKGEWFYDSEISPVTPKVNEKDMLLTSEDCERIFDLQEEEELNLSFLKRYIDKGFDKTQKLIGKKEIIESNENDVANTTDNRSSSDSFEDAEVIKIAKDAEVTKVEQYMKYFHVAKSTKLVEDGKHASRFALDD